MKEKQDAYLLYEYAKKIPFTVRIQIQLKEPVDPALLNQAAQEAISRFPYFSVKVEMDEKGGYVLDHNDAPIPVLPDRDNRLVLGAPETAGHLFAITYRDNNIWFNYSHSPCGAPGGLFWVKTTMYQYLTAKHGEIKAPADVKLPGTPVSDEEVFFPDVSTIPTDEPIKRYAGDSTKVGIGRFLKYLLNPFVKNMYYYEITIPANRFMEYAKGIDGSPNTIMAAMMFKTIAKYFPEKDGEVLSGRIADDYRKDVGADGSYRDFTRLLHVQYDRSMTDDSIQKLNMRARGEIIYQQQPELSYERFRQVEEIHRGIDAQSGRKNKVKYACGNSLFRSDIRDVFSISYVGQTDWGGMSDYITGVYTITDGDFMIEINALPDTFCLTFQLINKDRKPVDLFCEVISQEGLPYELSEMKARNMPMIMLPKK